MPVVFTCVLFDSDENWFEQIGKLRYAVTQTPQVFLDNQILEAGMLSSCSRHRKNVVRF